MSFRAKLLAVAIAGVSLLLQRCMVLHADTRTNQGVTLRWPPARGDGYRVLVRDAASGEFVLKAQTDEPHLELPVADFDPSRRYTWRPQIRKRRWQPWRRTPRPWRDLLPELRLPLPPPEDAAVTSLDLPSDGAPAHRVVIRDETIDKFVILDGVVGKRYLVNWGELDPSHRHRFKIQRWSDGRWVDLPGYKSLRPPLSLVRSLDWADAQPGGRGETVEEPLVFLFTCDTEINLRQMREPRVSAGLEHQIFCRHSGRDYGIGYLMDALERYGFRGTFFLDVLLEYQFGTGCLEPIVAAIQERGHDIQLHLHPHPHLLLAADESLRHLSTAIDEDDPDTFRRALAIAMDLFERRVGASPVAYRSGSYHLCDEFLPVLSEFGIKIDSSLYPFKNCRVSPWMQTRTQPFFVGNVLEIPISWVLDHRADERRAQQFAPMKGDSGQQDAFVAMTSLPGGPPATLVYMAHSYSMLGRHAPPDDAWRRWNEALRTTATEREYEALRRREDGRVTFFGEPDEDRMWVLERGLARLAARSDVKALTLKELGEFDLRTLAQHSGPVDPLPEWYREARRVHTSGTRRYSASFLGHLESEQPGRGDAQPAR